MLIEVECKQCAHRFDVDSAFVGTMRKCPECENRFLLDEKAAENDGVYLDELKGRKVACDQCLKSFVPIKVRRREDSIKCQFCLHVINIEKGERLHETVRQVNKAIRKGLLLGLEDDVIISKLLKGTRDLPNGQSSLSTLLHALTEQLPYIRMEVIRFGSSDTQFVKQRAYCDMCRALPPDHTLDITWRLTQQSKGSGLLLRLLFGQIGGLLNPVKHHHSTRQGIHFVCNQCVHSVGWWKRFFRMSLTTDGEYVAYSVRKCDLLKTETGMTLKYR